MLTDMSIKTAIRIAKGAQKPTKAFDGKGLYLYLKTNGACLWRFKYVYERREKLLSLGAYPEVPLKRAREKRDEARQLLDRGIDPSAARQAAKVANGDTIQVIALEWLNTQRDLTAGTIRRNRQRLETFVFPFLGRRPISSVSSPELLTVLRKIEAAQKVETARRVRQICSAVWRYAIATGRAQFDVSQPLKGALSSVAVKHHASITEPAKVGELLRAIDGYQGQPATAYALRLAPLLFVRPGELRRAEWSQFDLDSDQPLWRIPAEIMKMRDPHVVPLARQAVELLRELRPISSGRLLFPSLRTGARPMSENTVNAALRRLGYSGDEMVGHGFRSMASTLLNEQGWHPDLIELQLAHKERDSSRASYNKAVRLDERRRMMQTWADYLDGLRAGGNVVPFRRQA